MKSIDLTLCDCTGNSRPLLRWPRFIAAGGCAAAGHAGAIDGQHSEPHAQDGHAPATYRTAYNMYSQRENTALVNSHGVGDTITMPRRRLLSDQIRAAIRHAERRGITRYRIAKDSGVSDAQLTRLMQRKVDPRLDTAQRIIEAIGGEIRVIFDKQ